ncbi:mechanosensitive ion channel protein MscS [archaeon CG10_big_fil_rev_8_21_14_0_10_43_11]|nr:MAG: mechanosensitive ion channel protein MscS [archaeon CG10_big_fil_rev_8_21_14_0_10_43_11]
MAEVTLALLITDAMARASAVFGSDFALRYGSAVISFFATIISLKVFELLLVKRLKNVSKRTKNDVDDLVVSILDSAGTPFYLAVALLVSSPFLGFTGTFATVLSLLISLVLVYYAVHAITALIDFGYAKLVEKRKGAGEIDMSLLDVLSKILKALVWVIAIVLIIQNMGYDVSALVAGLGIGGIAIAFALQNILSDVLSSLSLFFDKPFKAGDFIVIGTDSGTVKKIGIKSTRITTLQGQELIVPNKELTETRVQNYKRMKKRRVVFTLGVTYQTPAKKLRTIPTLISDIFKTIESADLDRVHFQSFKDSSLSYEVVYYVNTSDYNRYMDTQQDVNLAIVEAFEKNKIELAYPTQTVFLQK